MNKVQASKENITAAGKITETIPEREKYSSRKEWEEVLWQKISESKELLSTLLTSYERRNLIVRAAILKGLSLGKGQRQLSRELSVSLQTINSVKKAITEKSYRSYSERGKKERKKREYSSSSFGTKIKRRGRPVRTKYGIVHMPY
ncbi:MAG: Trp family transcriptional regulator [Candidatus Liptonbacteria bacterium]|nr:Trp family transcriptional regulator [Candidatus Liptonbacteria bacterium]